MNITGRIFDVGSVPPRENGLIFMVATDGTHHALAYGGVFTNDLELAEGESLSKHFTLSENDFRADIAAEFPAIVPIDFLGRYDISFPETPFFVCLEPLFDTVQGTYQMVGFRYRIDSAGVVAIDGKYHYNAPTTPVQLNSGIAGSTSGIEINDFGYFTAQTGDFFGGLFQNVIRVPLTGDGIDPIGTTWAAQIQNMPGSASEVRASSTFNGHAIWPTATGVGVFSYQCPGMPAGTTPTSLWHTIMLSGGGDTGVTNEAALFGIPFADAQLNFAGNPGTDEIDDYQSPSVSVLADGRIEFTFLRRYSDQDNWIGVRRFIAESDLSSVTSFPFFQFELTADDPVGTGEQLLYSYREGNDVCFMIFDFITYIFKTLNVPLPADRGRRWFAEPGPIRNIV